MKCYHSINDHQNWNFSVDVCALYLELWLFLNLELQDFLIFLRKMSVDLKKMQPLCVKELLCVKWNFNCKSFFTFS